MEYFINTVFIFLLSLFPYIHGCSSKKELPLTPVIPNEIDFSSVYDVKKVYEYLADNINEYNNPCDDFLMFTCERWVKKHNFNDKKKEYISTYPEIKFKYQAFVKDVDSGKLKINSPTIKKLIQISKKCDSFKNNRAKFCHDIVNKIKNYPYHVHYFSKYTNITKLKEIINTIDKMSEVLKFEMKKIINTKKDIFDGKTKNALIKKLDSMKVNTKYIQTLYDTKYLEKCYGNVFYNDKDDVNKTYANLQKLNQILIDAEDNKDKDCLKLMRNDPPLFVSNKEEHFIKYNSEENFIFFTPLFLLEPIFHEQLPFFYNFGTFGTILAHKFMELFNINENHLYGQDKDKLITDDSKKKFSKKAECFTKQYNSESVDKTIKDYKTLENFIAYSGGIKLAHKAYVTYINKYKIKVPRIRVFDKYTGDELFFIIYGMINCEKYASKGGNNNMLFNSPHQVHVRGSLKNYKTFSDIFKCGTDKKMNLKSRCELW